ncbi:MAG: phosphate ABC transporter substrate-binding protein [Anaerolineales bacterium]
MQVRLWLFFILLVLGLAGCSVLSGDSAGDDASSVQVLENKGSDTMVNLALAWAEQYQSIHPEVSISVTGGGSGTGITALANNTVDIANASRAIKPEEIELIKQNGPEPVEFVVARDAIAVIVNPENPIDRLTLPQISDIYSGKINNWAELGGEDRPIVRLSRETNSGTHVYFLEEVLRLGDPDSEVLFSPTTLLLPSSEGITSEVRDNPNAIGYDGLGYVVPEVKVLDIAVAAGESYYEPSVQTVNDLTYPIARDLYMYTAGPPNEVEQAYLDWIKSSEGQSIVDDLGFVPILEP